ncbi:MAG: hypothetical protein PHG95_03025, partial [Patescibacteria group bacterium]|nr:hypothetical protein [Patescibacteria group bacterium]
MNKQQSLALARKKKKSVLIFDSKEYSIKKIPLNYRMDIKLPHQNNHKTINRDCYSPIEDGIDKAHKVAQE